MVLSDRTIKEELDRGRIVIDPFSPDCIQPASVDLHLGRTLRVFLHHRLAFVDLKQEMRHLTEIVTIDEATPFYLQPGQFALGVTYEKIVLPNDIVGRLDGKSSLGRLGLVVHSTAGYVDPGWEGNLTLELSNLSPLPISLYYLMKVSQISFMRLTTSALVPYGSKKLGSKYQGQAEPIPSRYYQEYQKLPLMRLPSVAVEKTRKPKEPSESSEILREWLNGSEFHGSVKRFSEALGVPFKTVQDWFYRGAEPSPRNRMKVFSKTQLPQFKPKGGSETQGSLPDLKGNGA